MSEAEQKNETAELSKRPVQGDVSPVSNMEMTDIRNNIGSLTARQQQRLLDDRDSIQAHLAHYHDLTDKMLWFIQSHGLERAWHESAG